MHEHFSVVYRLSAFPDKCLSLLFMPFADLTAHKEKGFSFSTLGKFPNQNLLLAALVDLVQETLKHALRQAFLLVHVRNQLPNLPNSLLLVRPVDLIQLQLGEHLFHPSLFVPILAAVVFIEHLTLLGRATLEGLVDDPRTLVVLDVGANLPDRLWGAVYVEIVVLDLKIFAQRNEDIVGLTEIVVGGKLKVVEGESDREIKAVIGGFIDDDE